MHGDNVALAEVPHTLDCDKFVSYCIEAFGPHISITRVGDPTVLLELDDSDLVPIDYKYIGFAGGYDYNVEWRWPVKLIPRKLLNTRSKYVVNTNYIKHP